jgi:uncharacterized protein (DUF4415 family)
MKGGLMKRELSSEQLAELESLAALPEDQIQTDDMPELRDWSDAKRGLFYHPIKEQITLRLDADLIDWFKKHHAEDEGYQTSINSALREYVRQQNQRQV